MDAEDQQLLVKRLQMGEHAAFQTLVERYHASMVRLAQTYTNSEAVAQEVTQDTWLAVLNGIDRFEGRSSFATWMFRILVNRAKSVAQRERRVVPLDTNEPAVSPSRFDGNGCWSDPPIPWTDQVDDRVTAAMMKQLIHNAIAELPVQQRQVVMLQDVERLEPEAICEILSLDDGHRRVLLHRGRSRVRQIVESQLDRSER